MTIADFNTKAKSFFEMMNAEEQTKALSILSILNGLDVERAQWILSFCKASIETKAVVKI